MKRILTVSFASVALLTLAPVVFADVVGPVPTSCPEGGMPSTCHGGPHCRPIACTTNADCQDGRVCQDRSFCVGVINCAGKLPPDADPSMYESPTVESTCATGDTCDAGGSCKVLKVCVPGNSSSSSGASTGNPPGDTGSESSCSCRLGGSAERLGALSLAFGTLISLALRRRKQR